jgi:hypothetical protein
MMRGMLMLLPLATIGFAWRGIALLLLKRVKPGRVVSVTGVVAMISVWVFAGVAPFVCKALFEIYREFQVMLAPKTELTLWFFSLAFRYGLLWYPTALGLSFCALTMPEILFRRSHVE